jgi:queuine tRNA-ribosyltransferase
MEVVDGNTPLKFVVHATVGPARASTLTLPHGEVLTPVFMPVGTQVSSVVISVYQ